MGTILDKLINYCNDDYVPMHMPGHKRNTEEFVMGNPFSIDITEIDGFDNLHNPKGILQESMDRASTMYGSDCTLYLVNGSSSGLIMAVSAVAKRGTKIIVGRNSHNSVYNAIYLNELTPVYVYPDSINSLGINSLISAESVDQLLSENEDVSAVIITSPTYEGVVSDVKAIAEVVHRYNIPLIVDEAHGAHFHFAKEFPEPAIASGADIVVQSIHKTLPSFTQTALLHIKGHLVDMDKIRRYYDIYQSTSPSYILIAGIDNCIDFLLTKGPSMFVTYMENLKKLRANIRKLNYIGLFEADDISKVILFIKNGNLNGKQFYDILLERFHIQLEMASLHYVIAMTSVGDKLEYYEKFMEALSQIDKLLEADADIDIENSKSKRISEADGNMESVHAKVMKAPYFAMNEEYELVEMHKSVGRISASSICVYPPGIPVVFPGELIKQDLVEYIKVAYDMGLEVIGLEATELEAMEFKKEKSKSRISGSLVDIVDIVDIADTADTVKTYNKDIEMRGSIRCMK